MKKQPSFDELKENVRQWSHYNDWKVLPLLAQMGVSVTPTNMKAVRVAYLMTHY